MKAEYTDSKNNITTKVIEPFVIGESEKNGEFYVGVYQSDGESTSGNLSWKTGFLENYNNITVTEEHFTPCNRDGFNPMNPINNVPLVEETITIVDYECI